MRVCGRRRGAVVRAVALLALAPLAATPVAAQTIVFAPRVQPELRVEVVAVGAGVVAAAGAERLAQRADLTMRFLLDPFAQTAWGPYAGGGLTVRRDGSERAVAGLVLVLGVEGRRGRRWTPSAEFALGEGVRFALVLRRSRTNGR